MNCFLQCPHHFHEEYVLKNKPTIKSDAMQCGIEFHDFANRFFDHIKFIEGTLFIDDNFLQGFKERCVPQCLSYIDNFISFELDRWEICKNLLPTNPTKIYMPLLREAKFVSDKLERLTIIDRLDLRMDGNYTLVEYKTGKFADKDWKKTELRREMCFERSVPEVCPEFYKKYPADIKDFVVYFPQKNDTIIETFNGRSISAMEKAVEKIREAMRTNSYPYEVNFLCRYCWLSPSCPMLFEGQVRV
jgi:hypothetical protein